VITGTVQIVRSKSDGSKTGWGCTGGHVRTQWYGIHLRVHRREVSNIVMDSTPTDHCYSESTLFTDELSQTIVLVCWWEM
jgi:hypothetical protein